MGHLQIVSCVRCVEGRGRCRLRDFHVLEWRESRRKIAQRLVSRQRTTSTIANFSKVLLKNVNTCQKANRLCLSQITPSRQPPLHIPKAILSIQPFRIVYGTVFSTNNIIYSMLLLLQVPVGVVIIIYRYCYWREHCHRTKKNIYIKGKLYELCMMLCGIVRI